MIFCVFYDDFAFFPAKRRTAETKQNDRSSRSHCIFRIVIILCSFKIALWTRTPDTNIRLVHNLKNNIIYLLCKLYTSYFDIPSMNNQK